MLGTEVDDDMDLSSKEQYIQRAINIKLDVTATASLQTIYTTPSGGDFDFAIIKSFVGKR